MKREIPNVLYFGLQGVDLENRGYIKEIDFVKKNLNVTHLGVGVGAGVSLQNVQQCHKALKEEVDYAHKMGFKICLRLVTHAGFYNAAFLTDNPAPVDQVELFPIPDPAKAEAIVNDIELTADENGSAKYTYTAVWGRSKIMPIYSQVVRAYVFEKTADGFYKEETLEDVTDQVNICEWRTYKTSFTLNLGKEYAGKQIFVLLAQYYNYQAVSDAWEDHKKIIDNYADIPFDGVIMDEYGYLLLNVSMIRKGEEPPFRGRIYSAGMKKYYREKLGIDLDRLLFDMRYAPDKNEKVRIQAINRYFETLRVFPLDVEKKVYRYAKKVFGKDAYISCHNTFHNNIESDEIWRTACNWWDIPRDFAHTDENISYPVRMGIMLACKSPIDIDMYYSREFENYYDHMIKGAPFGTREWHHSYRDFTWGRSFTEPEFLKNVNIIDRHVAALNDFQTKLPRMDVLVVYGAAAQNNWYPDESARSMWDIDGTLHIQSKCDEMWNAGYRCALVPDYAIEDGRIRLVDGKIDFHGQKFSHLLFLYPKYAKKGTYEFLNSAQEQGVQVAAVGPNGIDFYGEPASLTIPCFEQFDLKVLEGMACQKSAIEGGCVYSDGSFSLVSHAMLTGEATDFDFTVDGVRYTGTHTGILAYRKGRFAFASQGSALFANGKSIPLDAAP